MSNIEIEDRTQESVEERDQRQAMGAGMIIARAAYQLSGSDGRLTLRSLAAALGLGIAKSGAPIEEVFELVKRYASATRERMDAGGIDTSGSSGN